MTHGQYSGHIYVYTLNWKFLLILNLYDSSQWRFFRHYCSSNSNHLVQIENWTRCDVWTIFNPRCTNTLWISNFHCNCICIFNSMKIYQILLQLQLKLFSSNRKLNLLWCMDNIQATFTYTLWIENFYWYCIYMIHLNEDFQILLQLQLKPFSSNWKLNTMWCMDNIQLMLYKYTLNSKFLLILYLYDSSQWRFFRYYCSSNSNHLVQIESWTRCDVWTIFSTHFINTLWVWNFHCNCICIFNSMKIYQILLQLRLKVFSSNWKLNLLRCMDNIQYTFYKYTLSLKFSLQLYLYI